MKVITFDDIKNMRIDPLTCYTWAADMIRHKDDTQLPPKISLHPADGVFCNVMPCIIGKAASFSNIGGVKVVNRYPERNPSLDSVLMLIDMETGEFLAMMDANWITAMRTGAVAAHSIELFAKKDYSKISMLGLGNVARAALLELAAIEKDQEFTVKLLRYKGQEKLFAERFEKYTNIHFEFAENYEELIRKAEVVVSCVTYFGEDICTDDCFDEGVLVVPVHTRGFSNCDLFFDKVYADDTGHVCHFKNFDRFRSFSEVTDVVNGQKPGRESDRERILAYNIGLSVHDINYAARIYQMMREEGKLENLQDIQMNAPVEKFWI